MGRRLGDFCEGRDNNFNLIRIVAAASVLVSHAYPLTLGPEAVQPLQPFLGTSLGWVAVCVFFAISGFLIARSFDRKERLADWFAARVMRLFPALFVVVVLTALILGPLITVLPSKIYFSDPDVVTYIFRNMTLVSLQFELPGVFEELPYPRAINGSLWTLFHEVVCYLGVFLIGFIGLLRRPIPATLALAVYFLGYAVTYIPDLLHYLPGRFFALRDLSLPFAIGTALYIWRDQIPLNVLWCGGLALMAALLRDTAIFHEAFVLWLSYTVFVVAYLPGGLIRRYNRLGDYSYGLYIYAFPAQQLMVYLFGPMTPLQNMLLAFPAALFCAILSWHWVEKPALASRHRLADSLARVWARP